MSDPWVHLNDPTLNARQRRDYQHTVGWHDGAFDPDCFSCRIDFNGPRCDVCGEPLYGEIAEVVRNEDIERGGLETHLIVHESCYDRERMALA